MKFSAKPVKGTFDVLPEDMELRNWVRNVISNAYLSRGYTQIETPCIENLDLLTNSEGGENLSLLFKILKRGNKLDFNDLSENALCDLGLRFDLTLPLSRFYANNRNELPMPFKAFQTGYVWRAERPQKGRFRQFTQCDIDIIGDKTIYAEIDLMLTVPKALYDLGFRNFTIKINDRRLLKELVLAAGFTESQFDTVCISLDKTDKIGTSGVISDLQTKGFEDDTIRQLISSLEIDLENFDSPYARDLKKIMDVTAKYYSILFDPTLVRGMGYYTGPIFEVVSDEFKGSIAGGGRYDNLLSKFQNESVPAVGFAIGFERIVAILKERGFTIPKRDKRKIALIVLDETFTDKAIALSESLIAQENIAAIHYVNKKKLGKKIEALEKEGYEKIQIVDENTTEESFKSI
ncbi:histidyl-tRNA synthetase [Anaerosolibacter carboniphilus]|uniref:Histidine--tRNA ligase n=1 Tax=Anaerosolibacter carboniphilus TaxID=1417629 RepID=A0A841KJL0_9FIRM|nr:histidine--tRNA ligase [Anaerosolibacter carboniphilus]MBB6214054.1 histidyl-tRNA synthetase [Anaerosolibacter carboniphilus]